MHFTAKKTTALITEGGNNYVITVKDNQPRLLAQLKTLASHQKPCERVVDIEQIRGRTTCRIVKVFTDLKGIDLDWLGRAKPYSSRTYRYPLRKAIFNGELLHKLSCLNGDYIC